MEKNLKEVIYEMLCRWGNRPGADGKFLLKPSPFPIDYDLWRKLTESQIEPLMALEALIPRLAENYREALEDRVYNTFDKSSAFKEYRLEALCGEWDREKRAQALAELTTIDLTPEAWLDAPVWANLGVTVDSWSEYLLNTVYPSYDADYYYADYKTSFKYSSLMWLTRRQGYTQRAMQEALHLVKDQGERIVSEYLRSAAMEVWHELDDVNQLGFFMTMPLRDVLAICTMQRWGRKKGKWPGYILVSKDVRCGFFTTGSGSCSLIGIQLEKDVKLGLNEFEIYPDGTDGYAIYEVCCDNIWNRGHILHWGMPRSFRRDAASLGMEIDREHFG